MTNLEIYIGHPELLKQQNVEGDDGLWAEHIASRKETMNAYRILVSKSLEKCHLEDHTRNVWTILIHYAS